MTAHEYDPVDSFVGADGLDRAAMALGPPHAGIAGRQITGIASAQVVVSNGRPTAILTSSIAVENPPKSEIKWLYDQHGFAVTKEGSHGKVLLTAPPDAAEPERQAARVAAEVFERGNVTAAQPNLIQLLEGPNIADDLMGIQWALDNPGTPGVVGADVAANAAWTLTTGSPGIRVAILDDGVEVAHPAIHDAIVAEHNFVETADGAPTTDSTPPNHDDYHGTACAGIIASRDPSVIGLAHGADLVACRIATRKLGSWQLDWFAAADAIDWCWEQAQADVLSLSWQCGVNDVVTNALGRARTNGRDGKGSVVVASAGNNGGRLVYPASVEGVLAVGATNQWDQRKTYESSDGENNWASNFGTGLGLMAPGVKIKTLDLTGPAGLVEGGISGRFSGTSAAAPFASATAALVLSSREDLHEADVRQILQNSTDGLGPRSWDAQVGYGRLNAYAALRAARRFAK
jgi:subtilisin family serine protease